MLLDCYEINGEGTDIKVEPNKLKLTHDSLAIIVSHTNRCIYVFKGANTSIIQKFASARIGTTLRLQHGYRIKHIEEAEGIDVDFVPILDFFGGIKEEEKTEKPKVLEKLKATEELDKKSTPVMNLEKKVDPTIKATSTAVVTEKPIKTVKPKESLQTQAKLPENIPSILAKIVKTMMTLEPPAGSSCDYLLVGSKLYIILGEDKADLRNGKFKLEEVTTLPEGVFPAENYYPRILVSNQKIIGVEFWAHRK